jgi:hypothetical protein
MHLTPFQAGFAAGAVVGAGGVLTLVALAFWLFLTALEATARPRRPR